MKPAIFAVSTVLSLITLGCGEQVDTPEPPASAPAQSVIATGPAITEQAATGVPEAIAIASDQISIHVSEPYSAPEDDTSPNLYAIHEPGIAGRPDPPQQIFKRAAGGELGPPLEGQSITLIGRIPWQVYNRNFFVSEEGSISGNSIEIPLRCAAEGVGLDSTSPNRVNVYVKVALPALPRGRYHARISFSRYTCNDYALFTRAVNSSYLLPLENLTPEDQEHLRIPHVPDPAPLTCEFEVRGPTPPNNRSTKRNITGLSLQQSAIVFSLDSGGRARKAFLPLDPRVSHVNRQTKTASNEQVERVWQAAQALPEESYATTMHPAADWRDSVQANNWDTAEISWVLRLDFAEGGYAQFCWLGNESPPEMGIQELFETLNDLHRTLFPVSERRASPPDRRRPSQQ